MDKLSLNEDFKILKSSFKDSYEEIKERMVTAPADRILLLQSQALLLRDIFNLENVIENDRPDTD